MKRLSLLFSAEFFFASFLLAGYFKGGIPWFPMDITIFCLIVTIGFALFKILKNPKITKQSIISVLMFSMFTIIIIISNLITDSEIYATEKTIRYLVITTWSFLGVYVLIDSKSSLEKFLKSLILISFIVSLVGFKDLIISLLDGTYNGTIFVMNTDYLALGRTVGSGLILLISFKWFDNIRLSKTSIVMSIVMAIVILFSGGKMPLISVAISLLIINNLATKITHNKKIIINKGVRRLTCLFIVVIIFLVIIALKGEFNDLFWRMKSLFGGSDESALARISLYKTAIQMIKQSPLIGTGWASFPLFYYGMDKKVYPHNIFLEVFSELGILGIIVLILLLLYGVYHGFNKFKKKYKGYNNIQLAIIGGFLFFFLNANTSGDITDNKILFTFIALITNSLMINKIEEDKIKPY